MGKQIVISSDSKDTKAAGKDIAIAMEIYTSSTES